MHLAWQKWSLLKRWLVRLFLFVAAFFQLQHEKHPELSHGEQHRSDQTTPKGSQSQLLARLDAIQLNVSNPSTLDDSSDSALGVAPHLPDGPQTDFHGDLLRASHDQSTIYSSTPIIHSGLNLRRSRLQTPNSPM